MYIWISPFWLCYFTALENTTDWHNEARKKKRKEEGGENDSSQNPLIQLKWGRKTWVFVAFGSSWRNYHLALHFSICLVICYFGSCSVAIRAVIQIKAELAGFTGLYSSLSVADGRISYFWQLYSIDVFPFIFFFLSHKAMVQNATFIHDTLKM